MVLARNSQKQSETLSPTEEKAPSAVFMFSFNIKKLSSSYKTAAVAASTLISSAAASIYNS